MRENEVNTQRDKEAEKAASTDILDRLCRMTINSNSGMKGSYMEIKNAQQGSGCEFKAR